MMWLMRVTTWKKLHALGFCRTEIPLLDKARNTFRCRASHAWSLHINQMNRFWYVSQWLEDAFCTSCSTLDGDTLTHALSS